MTGGLADSPDARPAGGKGWRELLAVLTAGAALAAALTYPFVPQMAEVARIDSGDGQFSIWNVAWVARTIVADPRHLFDANIFYPRRWTLAYSEDNLGAGLLAVPVYWATRNPYLAHNVVFVLALTLSVAGAYYLVRYLTGDRRAAAVSGVTFGFCPYVFAHTTHIQLLMTAGLPFSMLAFHRLADRPSAARASALAAVLAAQAASCGYYAIFAAMMVGAAVLTIAATRRWWRDSKYWTAVALAAAMTLVMVVPLFLPYLALQRTSGFGRSLDEAARYSADWRAYLASSALAHRWILPLIGRWREVLFPGFVATTLGVAGMAAAIRGRGRLREGAMLYSALGIAAFWVSLGPAAGLYTALYRLVPLFTWMRAPSRFGVIVALALSVLAGMSVRAWLARARRPALVAVGLTIVAAGELAVPLRFNRVPPLAPVYRALRTLPAGPVIELPFWSRPSELHGHTRYMLASMAHWMPLINGYSDYIPPDFAGAAGVLRLFPTKEAFERLAPLQPRYAIFHMQVYGREDRAAVASRLREFASYLRPVYMDEDTRLYEIVAFP